MPRRLSHPGTPGQQRVPIPASHSGSWVATWRRLAVDHPRTPVISCDSRPSPRAFGASLPAPLLLGFEHLAHPTSEWRLAPLRPLRGHFPRRIPGGSQAGPKWQYQRTRRPLFVVHEHPGSCIKKLQAIPPTKSPMWYRMDACLIAHRKGPTLSCIRHV